jgi:predicted DNA-binding transcriptional regulator YafY
MRADRLLAMLMTLQIRGKMTALELAEELEVSERTVYRDVEALSTAGVPVYAERGPGGGISLLEAYRTNLTGLNADEARALFMLSIPTPLLQLGVGQELKAALLKVTAALPDTHRKDQQAARQRIHLDASWWGQSGQPGPHLGTVQQSVWQERALRLVTRTIFGAEIEQVVEPLGLVAKANEWYLVALRGGRPHVYRVASLVQAEVLAQPVQRPPDFDLAAYWERYCAHVEAEHGLFWVRACISPILARDFRIYFGERSAGILAEAGLPGVDGWREVRLPFDNLEQARERILGLGGAIRVMEPDPLRESVIDFARQTLAAYQSGAENFEF